MTDQEINEAVARKLGKPAVNSEPHQFSHGHRVTFSGKCLDGDCGQVDGIGYRVPDYCHSIAAVWEVTPYLDIRKFTDWPTPKQLCEAFLANVGDMK
jgi:starvation-inducible outer membrane lipoprotein